MLPFHELLFLGLKVRSYIVSVEYVIKVFRSAAVYYQHIDAVAHGYVRGADLGCHASGSE